MKSENIEAMINQSDELHKIFVGTICAVHGDIS